MGKLIGFLIALMATTFCHWSTSASDEADLYIVTLREKDIEDKILSSPLMKQCQESAAKENEQGDANKDQLRKCFEQVLSETDDESVEELAGEFNLDTLNFEITKSTTAIKEYLSHRLSTALYGKDYEKKRLREQRLVGQKQFLSLYQAQVSKNLVMEVSQYCLENVGIVGNAGSLLQYEEEQIFKLDLFHKDAVAKAYTPVAPTPELEKRVPMNFDRRWAHITEYNYCPNFDDDPKSPCSFERARTPEIIEALKERELELAAKHDPNILGQRYLFCSTQIVKNMCEIYRCNNVYTTTSLEENRNRCLSEYGIAVTRQGASFSLEVEDPDLKKGQLACNLMSKVETYRKTLEAIKEIEQGHKELSEYTGVDLIEAGFHAGAYDGTGRGDAKSIDEITSISSKELVNEAKGLQDISEEVEQLQERCFESGELKNQDGECAQFSSSINAENLAQIELANEAQTEAYLRRVRQLNEENDPKKLEEFLIKHGLHEYLENMEDFPVHELVKLIEDKYRSERQALINNMKDRFYAQTRIKKNDDSDNTQAISAVASEQIDEIKNQTERIETLVNYSNIVSSYLEVEEKGDESGKTFRNTRSRMVEGQGYRKHAGDEAAKYEVYFRDTENSAESSGGFSAEGSFIDSILGFGEAEQ